MRICQLIDYGGKTGGSFIDALRHLAGQLRARGDQLSVVATEVPGEIWTRDLRDAGADVHLVRSPGEAASTLRALAPDIIHSHFNKYDVLAARHRGARIIWHVHSVREDHSPLAELRARIKYQLIGMNISDWLCVSGGVRAEVLQRGAPLRRVRVVANGIDATKFRPPTEEERRVARARFDLAPDDRVLLFFDRTPVKGGAVLRAAMEALHGIRLLVNGGPDDEWERFAAGHDVIRAPRMDDPRWLYWAADAFVLPSLGEGFAFVLSEAAACGLPVAASDIPPAIEMLGGSPDAFIFPRGDAAALATAVEQALAREASGDGRERIVRGFSLDRWSADLVDVYRA